MNTPINRTSGSSLPLDTLPLETFSPSLAASSLWLRELPILPMEETVSELSVVSSDITAQTTLIIPTIQTRSTFAACEREALINPINQVVYSAKPASPRESRLPFVIAIVVMSILTVLTMMEIFYPYWLR